MTTTIQLLNELRTKLENREMSVLIGSGFSKNVDSELFPSWGGLLYDMTYLLYQKEIDLAWRGYLEANGEKAQNKKAFYDDSIKHYSESVGYLNIVTKYIERKGIRESITAYIEERIPRISKERGKLFLNLNNTKPRELTQEMLSQHRTLVNLPWNNIYTTNYDGLLEASIDNYIKEELEKRISGLEKELVSFQKEEEAVNKEVNEIEQAKLRYEVLMDLKLDAGQMSSRIRGESEQNEREQETKLREKERVLDSIRRKTKDSQEDLKALREGLTRCLTIVKDSSELSLKRNKNIIKLHGSLRESNNSNFGFDNDPSKHYIISHDDFETYPKKHEAFTQLMRISLLQESYCLIGFSGVDPNFTSWISWVRDILERDKLKKDKSFKIYMVDMGLDELGPDMLMYFNNHRIARLALMEESTIYFLEQTLQTKILNRKDRKSVLNLFLKYLAQSSDVVGPKSVIDILNLRNYRKAWGSLNFIRPEEIVFSDLIKASNKIVKLKSFNRIPNLTFGYSHVKKNLLVYAKSIFEHGSVSKTDAPKLLNLIEIAVMDMFTPIDSIWPKDHFEFLMDKVEFQNKEIQRGFKILNLRAAVLRMNEKEIASVLNTLETLGSTDSDDIICEKAFHAAFSLDFDKLKKLLKKWDPTGKWVAKRAGLLSFWNLDESIKTVSQHCETQLLVNNQEYLYALELLDFLKRNKSISSYLTAERKKIQKLENAGLKSSLENLDVLIGDLNKKENKIKPYNEGRFSISNTITFSNDLTDAHKGMQFIQLLMETGFPLVSRSMSLKDSKKWYQVFQSVFEDLPFPCLFYSLQYSDEKVLRRIGQDYVFSDSIRKEKANLLGVMLRAYMQKETPDRFKEGLLIIASEFFNVVDVGTWEKSFLSVLELLFQEGKLLQEYNWTERKFVAKALSYVKELDTIRFVIYELLHHLDERNQNQVIDILYHLAQNKRLKKHGVNLQTNEIEQGIKRIISRVHSEECLIFVVGNLYEVLSEEQLRQIPSSLNRIDFEKLQNPRTLRVLLYLTKGDSQILSKIKKTILGSKNLWANGIDYYVDSDTKKKRRKISSRSDFIEISNLRKSSHREIGLEWTKAESKLLYDKMVKSLKEIQDTGDKGEDIVNFGLLAEEMYQFLLDESDKLASLNDYTSVLNDVRLQYSRYSGYTDRIDGLISKDKQTVKWALRDVFGNHFRGHKEITEDEINIILSKLILESGPAIEACLAYVVSWFKELKDSEEIKRYSVKLISVLNLYCNSELEGYDKAYVQQQLVELAWLMKKTGERDPLITKSLRIKETTSFNNLKELEFY